MTGSQMKAIDQYTIQTIGIPSLVLMERAAAAVADTVAEEGKLIWKEKNAGVLSVWAVCGTGNNGADGIAAARLLLNRGYEVTVILVGNQDHGTEEYARQKQIARNLDMHLVRWGEFLPGRCDILIDAVFGVGLSREVEGEYRDAVLMMDRTEAGLKVAVDIPSGVHSDTGRVLGAAAKAHVTVTFGYEKLGSVLYPGRGYCGRVKVCDIGFPVVSLKAAGETAWAYGPEDLERLPERPEYSNKGTFGRVLAAAGSPGMCGAAYLCALAAYRTGTGLVKILTAEENAKILQQLLPEAVLAVYDPEEAADDPKAFHAQVEKECAWADVIVAGPGLGMSKAARLLVREFLMNAYVPMVLDADALNVIAADQELSQYYTDNIIITPHLGEMSRLSGKTVEQIQENLIGTASEYSSAHGICCCLKDAAAVVTGREGQCYVNTSGNNSMAKAGSGDVLAGTIAGLLAQGAEIWDAATLGVYIHGLAGDRIRQKKGAHGLLARELAEELGWEET